MSTLPMKLNIKLFEMNDLKYAFDLKRLSVIEINDITYELFMLLSDHTEDQIINILNQKYRIEEIRSELELIKKAIDEGSLSQNDGDAEYAQQSSYQPVEREPIFSLAIENFNDESYIDLLKMKDDYLLINLQDKDLINRSIEVNRISKFLLERVGRYRVNIWMDDNNNLLEIYQMVLSFGFKSFDLRFENAKTAINFSKEDLNEWKAFLLGNISDPSGPQLAVIKDVIRILGYQLPKSYCTEECIGKWICRYMGSKKPELCSLYQWYFEMGVYFFTYYIKHNIKLVNQIMGEDLIGCFTATERGIFSKSYYWRNNLYRDNWIKINAFKREPKAHLVTYWDCEKI